MRTDPRKVEAQVDGSRDAEQVYRCSFSALLQCNLLALDTAGAARGSLLFPTLPLIVAVDIPPSEAVVGQLHPVSAGPGQFAKPWNNSVTRVPIV
jgi:hypothetical protein